VVGWHAANSSISLSELARTAQSFVIDNPESGRRGQAFAAAVLDCVFPRVELGSIHDPDAFDVLAFRRKADKSPSPVVQVKQKVVDENAAINLGEAASEQGLSTALLIAIAPGQHALDDQALAIRTSELGVVILTVTSIAELMSALAVFSKQPPEEIVRRLPLAFKSRLQEIEASEDAVAHWMELIEDLFVA
jgi:hypothetical protein